MIDNKSTTNIVTSSKDNNPVQKDENKLKVEKLLACIKAIVAIKYSRNDYQCQEIIPNLYLGSIGSVLKKNLLYEQKITHIVQCMNDANLKPPLEEQFMKVNNVVDSLEQNLLELFDETYEFIENALNQEGNKVLVHCFAGKSRSSSFVIAYLMKKLKIPYDKAYQIVKEKRDVIQPNSNFVKQLKQYEKQIEIVDDNKETPIQDKQQQEQIIKENDEDKQDNQEKKQEEAQKENSQTIEEKKQENQQNEKNTEQNAEKTEVQKE